MTVQCPHAPCAPRSGSPGGGATDVLLQTSLAMSVPLRIDEVVRGRLDTAVQRARRKWEEDEGVIHENIPYRGAKRGQTAKAFVALTEVIAVLAFAKGGVWAFGLHFHAVHPDGQPVGQLELFEVAS